MPKNLIYFAGVFHEDLQCFKSDTFGSMYHFQKYHSFYIVGNCSESVGIQ